MIVKKNIFYAKTKGLSEYVTFTLNIGHDRLAPTGCVTAYCGHRGIWCGHSWAYCGHRRRWCGHRPTCFGQAEACSQTGQQNCGLSSNSLQRKKGIAGNFLRAESVLGDPEVTANIVCKSRNLPGTYTQNYSTDLR